MSGNQILKMSQRFQLKLSLLGKYRMGGASVRTRGANLDKLEKGDWVGVLDQPGQLALLCQRYLPGFL